MLEFYKHTHEDAVRQSLRDDPGAAGRILCAGPDDTVHCVISFQYTVPAKFAKAVLEDVAKEDAARARLGEKT